MEVWSNHVLEYSIAKDKAQSSTLYWGFTAQSAHLGHVEHTTLFLEQAESSEQLINTCAHPYARNWQLPF